MKFVYICSPLRGDMETNIRRANGYSLFAAKQSFVPIAPHVMFTGFLDDNIPEERKLGLAMGLELMKRCDEVWGFWWEDFRRYERRDLDGAEIRHSHSVL